MISGILRPMTVDPSRRDVFELAEIGADAPASIRVRVDAELDRFLGEQAGVLHAIDPATLGLVDELRRLIHAGGSRLRPLCAYWGYRAAGGIDGVEIVRAAAALELLHAMALIHDDLMDEAKERRGVPSTHRWFAEREREAGDPDPEDAGRSLAILAGDLAAVFADRALLEAGFSPERLAVALDRYHAMRVEMAAGQYLDLTRTAADPGRVASLKGGSYSIVGPLVVGAALAGGSDAVTEALRRVGEPLGRAFQLRDDLRDGDAATGITWEGVRGLVAESRAALAAAELDHDAAVALAAIAEAVAQR